MKIKAKTISTFDFMARFPTEKSARDYLEELRWRGGIICPNCDAKSKASAVIIK